MSVKIFPGEPVLWQWDIGRRLVVDDTVCCQVHFNNGTTEEALAVEVHEQDGQRWVNVPNILLQSARNLIVYTYKKDSNGAQTRQSQVFNVYARRKPADYVYTETEILTYHALDERLKELEGEGLANAVAEYLKENPVQAGATAEEAAQIAQNKQDIETLNREKLDASKLPEAVNDALAQAKASGEFKGEPGKTPVKGIDYFDGDDYILTDTDKTEIAEQAAKMVEIPEEDVDLTGYATEEWVGKNYQPKGNYLTEVPSDYAKKSELPTKVSQLENDKGYLTEHQDISGKLDASELPQAINTALEQAKASGEFKGDPGDDYVLTEADKQEIAELTAPLVDVPSGGGSGGSAEWELLNTIILEEDSNSVIIDKDSNGNSFDLSAFMFYIDRVASDLQTANGTIYVGNARSGYFGQMQGVPQNQTRIWMSGEFMTKHMWRGSSGVNAGGTFSSVISYAGGNPTSAPMIRLYGYYFGAGTKITLYGVRK